MTIRKESAVAQVEHVPQSILILRERAKKLDRSTTLRACVEQCGLALGIANCASMLTKEPGRLASIALGLTFIGLVYAWFEWRQRALPQPTQRFESVQAVVTFYKQGLERKRDMHRTLWRWHLLPMAPGLIAILIWKFLGGPQAVGPIEPGMIAAFMFVWIAGDLIYERLRADHYQRELDSLVLWTSANRLG